MEIRTRHIQVISHISIILWQKYMILLQCFKEKHNKCTFQLLYFLNVLCIIEENKGEKGIKAQLNIYNVNKSLSNHKNQLIHKHM